MAPKNPPTIKLNVSGTIFEVERSTIVDQHPQCMLASLVSERWDGDSDGDDDGEAIFVPFNASRFSYVLDFMRYRSIDVVPETIRTVGLYADLDRLGLMPIESPSKIEDLLKDISNVSTGDPSAIKGLLKSLLDVRFNGPKGPFASKLACAIKALADTPEDPTKVAGILNAIDDAGVSLLDDHDMARASREVPFLFSEDNLSGFSTNKCRRLVKDCACTAILCLVHYYAGLAAGDVTEGAGVTHKGLPLLTHSDVEDDNNDDDQGTMPKLHKCGFRAISLGNICDSLHGNFLYGCYIEFRDLLLRAFGLGITSIRESIACTLVNHQTLSFTIYAIV